MKRRVLHFLLALTLIFTTCVPASAVFATDQGNRVNMKVSVDKKKPENVKVYYASYTYNTYVSLEDLAWALKGTDKAFDIKKDADGVWEITTKTDYTGEMPAAFDGVSKDDLDFLVTAGMDVQRLLGNNMRKVTAEDARALYLEIL